MEISHINITATLGMLGTMAALYRFTIKPMISSQKEEYRRMREWRKDVNTRLTLLEHQQRSEEPSWDKLRNDLVNEEDKHGVG